MADGLDASLLEALLDSWDRNNAILVSLLRAVPEGGLAVRPVEGSPSVAELFTHMHYAWLVLVSEDGMLMVVEWCSSRSRIAVAMIESPKIDPQSP
jgi:hypothetical protein